MCIRDRIQTGSKLVKIFGEEIAVNAQIEYLDAFSGHADKEGLLNWIEHMDKKPENIFIVHGEYTAQQALKNALKDRFDITSVIPDYEDTYSIEGDAISAKVPEYKSTRFDILELLSFLKQDVDDVSNIIKAELKNNVSIETSDLIEIHSKLDNVRAALDNAKSIK